MVREEVSFKLSYYQIERERIEKEAYDKLQLQVRLWLAFHTKHAILLKLKQNFTSAIQTRDNKRKIQRLAYKLQALHRRRLLMLGPNREERILN